MAEIMAAIEQSNKIDLSNYVELPALEALTAKFEKFQAEVLE